MVCANDKMLSTFLSDFEVDRRRDEKKCTIKIGKSERDEKECKNLKTYEWIRKVLLKLVNTHEAKNGHDAEVNKIGEIWKFNVERATPFWKINMRKRVRTLHSVVREKKLVEQMLAKKEKWKGTFGVCLRLVLLLLKMNTTNINKVSAAAVFTTNPIHLDDCCCCCSHKILL